MDEINSTQSVVTGMGENGSSSETEVTTVDVMTLTWLRAIFVIMYIVIFLLGISGNLLVVYVVVKNKSMQTITNIFITNLALSDIMMCLLAVPFTPLSAFLNNWVFGEGLCHLVPMTLGVSVYVSTLTSTAIAIDRYFVIVHPFKPRMQVCVCLLLIVAIWIISVSISLPLGIYQEVNWNQKEDTYKCQERWPKDTARQFFTVTSLVLQYLVPCSIISFCYAKVSLVLGHRSRSRIGTGTRSRDRDEMEIRRKRRTNKMLIAMISIFVTCWLPLNMVHISSEFNDNLLKWQFFYLMFFVAHVIAMSSTVYNPFLYAWMNENFRKEFKTVVPCLFSHGNRFYQNGNATQYTTVETAAPPTEMKNNKLSGNGKDAPVVFDSEKESVELPLNKPDVVQ